MKFLPLKSHQLTNATGWLVFAIAFGVYSMTVAPTASFWDCAEFIACANELEVTHPPGAPLFLLIGRLFAMLAGDHVQDIAGNVNMVSVIASAFTAMFTCWITVALALRGLAHTEMSDSTKYISAAFGGLIGGLCCVFADSIWWNAVEAEVYALSSFFTALVVWLMFKWAARSDQPGHYRWLILIAYCMGLSMGVHLLNLLTIPALALIYYYEKYTFSWGGVLATLGVSLVILGFIQYGLLQYIFTLSWQFEKIFTGTTALSGDNMTGLGWKKGTGAIIFGVGILIVLIGLIIYSQMRKKVILNVSVLCISMLFIGFSSYAVIYIRSNSNPPIDMNNPENLLSFLSYMKREQYGDRPLLWGPLYNGEIVDVKEGDMRYMALEDQERYVEDAPRPTYVYRPGDKVLFPRMYEVSKYHAGPFGYINYVDDMGEDPNDPRDDRPTRLEDFIFFLDYQLAHMYLRYFMWNFVGRSSDVQDDGWESGLEPLAYQSIYKGNKAKNHYYFIPLLIGLLGLVWQTFQKRNDAAITGLLFVFTGIAIIIYLNQWPGQPRERDYSFAGSFQTFCIWIGLGVIFLVEWLRKYFKSYTPYLCGAICLLAPLLMATQNWDDHTRQGRYIDREFAYNLLNSCAPNAILFTGGDNDTFPLWYIQEVEGVRTDVRVVNLELLISDWYIDQMQVDHNGALPLPITIPRSDYLGEEGLVIRGFPSRRIDIPIDKEALIANGIINTKEATWATDTMRWDFTARGTSTNPYILRKDLVIINIVQNIARNNWDRPIYFASMMAPDAYLGLGDFFRLEGLAYRVVPIKRSSQTPNDIYMGWIGQDIMQHNLTEVFAYRGLDNPDVYFDEHIRQVIIGASYQSAFYRLGMSYANEIQEISARNEIWDLVAQQGNAVGDTLGIWVENNQQILQQAQGRLPEETTQQLQYQIILGEDLLRTQNFDTQRAIYQLDSNQSRIDTLQSHIRKLMEVLYKKMPPSSIDYQYSDYAMLARVFNGAKMTLELVEVLKQLSNKGIDEVQLAIRVGRELDPNEAALSAILLSIQMLSRNEFTSQAQQLADTLETLTGDTRGQQLIQQEFN